MSLVAVNGAENITGDVKISGSKNSFLGIAFAAIALKRKIILKNVPAISDLYVTLEIYAKLGISYKYNSKNNSLYIDSTIDVKDDTVTTEIMSKIRGSIYITGAILSRNKQANLIEPGGCKIGLRPINFHIDAFKALGCTIARVDDDLLHLSAQEIKGEINIARKSVGATVNTILSSVHCDDIVTISNYAPEPEIDDLIIFLQKGGVNINKIGDKITIKPSIISDTGIVEHSIIPDRIEAVSYIVLGLIVNQKMHVQNINLEHIDSLIQIFENMGANLVKGDNCITILPSQTQLNSYNFETGIYPAVPTDVQAQLTLLNLHSKGQFTIKENIFENRYLHVPELRKLGYDIEVVDGVIHGNHTGEGHKQVTRTIKVEATDLRASITMVIASAIRDGITKVNNAYHIYRGYPSFIEKFSKLGIDIDIIS